MCGCPPTPNHLCFCYKKLHTIASQQPMHHAMHHHSLALTAATLPLKISGSALCGYYLTDIALSHQLLFTIQRFMANSTPSYTD